MKEVVVESLVRVTQVMQLEDAVVDGFVKGTKNEDSKREYAAALKKSMEADDVHVKDVKAFVRDIPEEKPAKKTHKKKVSSNG